MNHGAALADSSCLLFLHADTGLPADGVALAAAALNGTDRSWGRFDVAFDDDSLSMRTIAWFMNHRSALTGICTGDQALFTTVKAFEAVGRYPEIALMEDIALSRRLRVTGRPVRVRTRVVTSG